MSAALRARFEAAKKKREDARKLNEEEIESEDRRAKLPANYETKKRQAEWELEQERLRKEAEEQGKDYEVVKMMAVPADVADRIHRSRKRKKGNPDEGFSDFQAAAHRKYKRLTKALKPNIEAYQKSEAEWTNLSADSLEYGTHGKVSAEAKERLVADLAEQEEKHKKFSRRRAFHEDSDIDYINKRNMLFNKKAERFYGKYTQEIKDNLERGTAL